MTVLAADGGCSMPNETSASPSPDMAAMPTRPAVWAEPIDAARNLYRIRPGLYRSQRLERGDIALLQALGVRTVINLRAFHSDDAILTDTGIQSIDVPMHSWNIRDEQVVAALVAIERALPRGAVLIHCQHGADRTGLISAMYRILFQHWDREEALRELVEGGYGYHAIWKNIPRYIRNADTAQLRQAIQTQLYPPDDVLSSPTPVRPPF